MKNKGGRKAVIERHLFPGYISVEMEITDETWYLVKNTSRMISFIGSTDNHPSPASKNEVDKIMVQTQEGVERPRPRTLFGMGEMVHVGESPFTDSNGSVEEVSYERPYLRAPVTIFGRATPVEPEFGQVKKV